MAAAPISITHARRQVVTFSSSLYKDSLGLIFSRPEGRQNTGALLAPFKIQVWMAVLILAVMMCLILYAVVRFSKYLLHKSDLGKTKEELTLLDCVWFIFSGLMKQGFNKSSSYDPIRLLMATWWLTSMVIAAFYTANLTVYLTLENSIVEYTVEKFVLSGNRWVFKRGTAFSNALFKENASEYAKEFAMLKRSYRKGVGIMVQTEEEAMDFVRKGYSYMQEVNALNYLLYEDYLASSGQCQFCIQDLSFFRHTTAFAFPDNSPYSQLFSEYIEFLKKNGLLQKWMQQYLQSAGVCAFQPDKISRNEQALTLHEFYTAFFILCIGILIGIIVFSFEVWKANKNK